MSRIVIADVFRLPKQIGVGNMQLQFIHFLTSVTIGPNIIVIEDRVIFYIQIRTIGRTTPSIGLVIRYRGACSLKKRLMVDERQMVDRVTTIPRL